MHFTRKIVGYIIYAAAVLMFLEALTLLFVRSGFGDFAIAMLVCLVLIGVAKWVMPGAVDETKQ